MRLSIQSLLKLLFSAIFLFTTLVSSVCQEITIDGDFTDWGSTTNTAIGSNGATSLEVTDKEGKLCLHLSGTNLTLWSNATFLNTDCDASIGYNGIGVWNGSEQGADFLLEGSFSYPSPYISGNDINWAWGSGTAIQYNPNDYAEGMTTDIEYCFDLPPSCGKVYIGAKFVEDGVETFIPANGGMVEYMLIDPNLPVEYLSFEGVSGSYNSVLLSWSTATEINNDYFIVQKSQDGVKWNDAGMVDGNGNTLTQQNYKWEDTEATGLNYYRLKQVDYDGLFSFSDVINVQNETIQGLTVYPNPSGGIVKVRFSSQHSQIAKDPVVYNVLGEIVSDKIRIHHYSTSELSLDMTLVPNGVYYVKVGDEVHNILLEKR